MKQSKGRFAYLLRKKAERIASVDAYAEGYLLPLVAIPAVVIFAARDRIEYGFDEKISPSRQWSFYPEYPMTVCRIWKALERENPDFVVLIEERREEDIWPDFAPRFG